MKRKLKIISVVGARPQFIKLSPLDLELKKSFTHFIVHTGQHKDFEMSDIFFKQLKISKPNINLGISGGSHGLMTGRMIEKLEQVFIKQKPDLVLVFGDTNSTLAGALSAAKLNIPVGHVEAGLRSFVDDMPEEINRVLSDKLSSLLFCPTTTAIKNLKSEGIKKGVIRSGDLMFELLEDSKTKIRNNEKFLNKYNLTQDEFALFTLHRAANVDEKKNLEKIIGMLEKLSLPVVFPMHPRTLGRFTEFKLIKQLRTIKNVIICEPLGYYDILTAIYNSKFVMTDSGGLQKEAIYLRTPVMTLRDETEWVETLKNGNQLVGLNKNKLFKAIRRLPKVRETGYKVRNKKPSKIITDEIKRYLKGK